MTNPEGLISLWRKQSTLYERDGVVSTARVLQRCADELALCLRQAGEIAVGLNEAARHSGYAPDTLGRMVRDGRLTNYGRKNAPKVRLADLPLRPSRLPLPSPSRHRSAVPGVQPHGTEDFNNAA